MSRPPNLKRNTAAPLWQRAQLPVVVNTSETSEPSTEVNDGPSGWGGLPVAGIVKATAAAIAATATTRPEVILIWLGGAIALTGISATTFLSDRLAPTAPSLLAGAAVAGMLIVCGTLISFYRIRYGRRPIEGWTTFVAEVLQLMNVQYRKRNLSIRLTFKEVNADGTALVSLTSRYEVTNLTSQMIRYCFRAQFNESRRTSGRPPKARLSVRQPGMRTSTEAVSEFDPRNGAWLYEEWRTIGPGNSCDFEWTCEYVVDLPFAEFWATGHPTENFELVVDPGRHGLEVSVDVYRDPSLGQQLRLDNGVKGVDCTGLFLPFNGIHVDVRPRLPKKEMVL